MNKFASISSDYTMMKKSKEEDEKKKQREEEIYKEYVEYQKQHYNKQLVQLTRQLSLIYQHLARVKDHHYSLKSSIKIATNEIVDTKLRLAKSKKSF